MAGCTKCNLCAAPGNLDTARERRQVPCNVLAFKDYQFTVWRCTGCASLHSAEDAELEYFYSDYPPHRMLSIEPTRIGSRNQLNVLKRQGVNPIRPHSGLWLRRRRVRALP